MRVTINFLLKRTKTRADGKCPVYVRCTMDGKRFEIATGIFSEPQNWDASRQILKGRGEEIKKVNYQLNKMVTKINDSYNQLESMEGSFDIFDLKLKLNGKKIERYLLEVFNQVLSSIKAQIGNGYAIGTLKHYLATKSKLNEFVAKTYQRNDIALNAVNYQFLNSFDVFLKSTYRLGENTVWGYHRHLKKVLNDAVAMGYLTRNPYDTFKVKRGEANRDFLTMEEVKRIEQKTINIHRLEIVKDIFVFACYTGLSYFDISKLVPQHLAKGDDGEKRVIIDRSKTDSRCRIPLLPSAKRILDKYGNYPVNISKGLLLPIHSNQKMNSYLKELADICGITKNLSMHVARHTFATSVTLANGVPIETVSKMLGHNSIKTTQIYARIVDSKISEDMKKLRCKL